MTNLQLPPIGRISGWAIAGLVAVVVGGFIGEKIGDEVAKIKSRQKDTSSAGFFRGFGAKADSTQDVKYVSLQQMSDYSAIKAEDRNLNGVFETFTGYLDKNGNRQIERNEIFDQNDFPKDHPLSPYFNLDSLNLAYKTIRGQSK